MIKLRTMLPIDDGLTGSDTDFLHDAYVAHALMKAINAYADEVSQGTAHVILERAKCYLRTNFGIE